MLFSFQISFPTYDIFTKPTSYDVYFVLVVVFMKNQVVGNSYYIFFFIALLLKKLTLIV